MTDFYRNNEYLANALEWIRDNEPDDLIFAEVLYSAIGMSLEDTMDYLTAFGVSAVDREYIRKELLAIRR